MAVGSSPTCDSWGLLASADRRRNRRTVGAHEQECRILRLIGEAYRERLRRLAADLGVAGHVRFDDGFAEPDVIIRALTAAG